MLLGALATILLIVVINFFLFRAMPGSPERILGRNPNVTPEILEQTRERWGLDKPVFPDQFIAYVVATVRGDLGFSFVARGQTVVDVLARIFWPTMILFGLGELHRDRRRPGARRVLGLETRRVRSTTSATGSG